MRTVLPGRGGWHVPIVTSTDDVAVGMRLHEPAYAGAQLLLPAGKTLNSADVDYLR